MDKRNKQKKASKDKGKKAQLSDAEEAAVGVAKRNHETHEGVKESKDRYARTKVQQKFLSYENDFKDAKVKKHGERKHDHYIRKSNYETHDYEYELNDLSPNSDTEHRSRQFEITKDKPDDDSEDQGLCSQSKQKYGPCRVTKFKTAGTHYSSRARNKNELKVSKERSCDYSVAKSDTKIHYDENELNNRKAKGHEERGSREYKIARIYNDESSDDEVAHKKSIKTKYRKYDSERKSNISVTKGSAIKTDYLQKSNIKHDRRSCDNNFSKSKLRAHEVDSDSDQIGKSYENHRTKRNYIKENIKAANKHTTEDRNNSRKVKNINEIKYRYHKKNSDYSPEADNESEDKYRESKPDPHLGLTAHNTSKSHHYSQNAESVFGADCSESTAMHSQNFGKSKSYHHYEVKNKYEANGGPQANINIMEKRDYSPRATNKGEVNFRYGKPGADRGLTDYNKAQSYNYLKQDVPGLDAGCLRTTDIYNNEIEKTKSYHDYEPKYNFEERSSAKTNIYNAEERDYSPRADSANEKICGNKKPNRGCYLLHYNKSKDNHKIHTEVSNTEKDCPTSNKNRTKNYEISKPVQEDRRGKYIQGVDNYNPAIIDSSLSAQNINERNDYNAKKDTDYRLSDRCEAKIGEDASEAKKDASYDLEMKDHDIESGEADGYGNVLKSFEQKDQKLKAVEKLVCLFEERGYSDNESSIFEDSSKFKYQRQTSKERHGIYKIMNEIKHKRFKEIDKNIKERDANILCWCHRCKNKTANRKALNVETVRIERVCEKDKRRARSLDKKHKDKKEEPAQHVPGQAATAGKASAGANAAQAYSSESVHIINGLRLDIGYMQQFFIVLYDALNEDLGNEEGLFVGKYLMGQTLRGFVNKMRKIKDDFQKASEKLQEDLCLLLSKMEEYCGIILSKLKSIKNMLQLGVTVAKVCKKIDQMDLNLLQTEISHTNSKDFDFQSNCCSWFQSHTQLFQHFKSNELNLPKIDDGSLWSAEQMQQEIVEMRKKLDYLILNLENAAVPASAEEKCKNTKSKQQKIRKTITQETNKSFKKHQKYRSVQYVEVDQIKGRNALKQDKYEFKGDYERISKEGLCTCSCVACYKAVLRYRLEVAPGKKTKHFDTDASNGSNTSILSAKSTCLGNKILDLVGNRAPADVAIALHAETYDLYHINIVSQASGENIGCMYARFNQIERTLQTADLKPFEVLQVVD